MEGSQVGKVVDLKRRQDRRPRQHAGAPGAGDQRLYARNLLNFVDLLIDPETKKLVVNDSDDLIKGALITKDGKVVNPALLHNQAA